MFFPPGYCFTSWLAHSSLALLKILEGSEVLAVCELTSAREQLLWSCRSQWGKFSYKNIK